MKKVFLAILLLPGFAFANMTDSVVSQTNSYRVAHGQKVLKVNVPLNKAAQLKAEDMAKNGYFAHVSPAGKTPWYWFNQAGYHYKQAGENLAEGFTDATSTMQAWESSPTHNANLLKKEYREIGVGTAEGVYDGNVVQFTVQMFASPL